jgi:hypothetical protein
MNDNDDEMIFIFKIRFAQLQTKYGIAKLVSEYHLTLNPKTKVPWKTRPQSLTMVIEGGIWLNFDKIKK